MFSIENHLKRPTPKLPFELIAKKILGPKYVLGLSFVGPAAIQKLNRQYRKKDYTTNILSFPLSKTEGDMVINLSLAEKEAASFEHEVSEHLLFLFIHGCLHLKGMAHGSIMSKEENKFFQFFRAHVTSTHNRSRHRHQLPAGGRLRIQKGR